MLRTIIYGIALLLSCTFVMGCTGHVALLLANSALDSYQTEMKRESIAKNKKEEERKEEERQKKEKENQELERQKKANPKGHSLQDVMNFVAEGVGISVLPQGTDLDPFFHAKAKSWFQELGQNIRPWFTMELPLAKRCTVSPVPNSTSNWQVSCQLNLPTGIPISGHEPVEFSLLGPNQNMDFMEAFSASLIGDLEPYSRTQIELICAEAKAKELYDLKPGTHLKALFNVVGGSLIYKSAVEKEAPSSVDRLQNAKYTMMANPDLLAAGLITQQEYLNAVGQSYRRIAKTSEETQNKEKTPMIVVNLGELYLDMPSLKDNCSLTIKGKN